MIGKINGTRFFDLYRSRVAGGNLSQAETENLIAILDRAEADERLSIPLLASMIATARWETRRFERLREVGGDDYLRQYMGKGGNYAAGDYKKFRGGGWVHLTFRDNYRNATAKLRARGIEVNIEENPDLLCKNYDANYEVMVGGSLEGWFTGKKLIQYIAPPKIDYRNARMVINPGELKIADGIYKADPKRKKQCIEAIKTIVSWSKAIEAILRASLERLAVDESQIASLDETSEAFEAKPTPDETHLEPGPLTPPGEEVAAAPVDTPPSDNYIQASIGGAKRLNAFRTSQGITISSIAAGFLSIFTWARENWLLVAFIGTWVLIAMIGGYFVWNRYNNTQKELDELRMKSAMDKDKVTVR